MLVMGNSKLAFSKVQMALKYKYNSLEDYLISKPFNIDGELDDGWGAHFPVKGREIDATIIFSDITAFSKRTLNMNPIETLIFVNNYFSWISAEALRDRPGIVDKYIGDEIMVIFSNEFGSENHFIDALQTARWMSENDVLSFGPHIGIASGSVVVGYVGTPIKYNCSVFGKPVALAARCASIISGTFRSGGSIKFPAELWKDYDLNTIFPPRTFKGPDNQDLQREQLWELLPKRTEKIKNMPNIEIIEIVNNLLHMPSQSAEERAKEAFVALKKKGLYRKFSDQ